MVLLSDIMLKKYFPLLLNHGGEVVNLEWVAENPPCEAAGGLNMIGVIWLKRKS